MREHHPSRRKGASGTSELRAVAEEAWDFGAHALHAARDWFNGRRTSKMKGRQWDDMHTRGRGGAYSRASQDAREEEGQYGRSGRGGQPYGRAGWDRDREQSGDRGEASDPRSRYQGAAGTARGARGEDDEGTYSGNRDYTAPYGDDYDDYGSAWPRAGRRDFGPAGYGSGASFQREAGREGREYGASGFDESEQGGGSQHAYGRERTAGGASGRSFNDRWENAYGGGGPAYGGPAYGGSGGYASPQHQGYRESGLGRRGRGPKNYTRSDERIREDVSERLSDDDHLDASDIEVQVGQGVVTLTGTVEERWEKHRAEDIAGSCSGVRDVLNQIRVGSAQQSASMSSQSASQPAASSTGTGAGMGTGTSLGAGTGAGTGSRPGAPAQTGSTSSPGTTGQSGASSTASRQN